MILDNPKFPIKDALSLSLSLSLSLTHTHTHTLSCFSTTHPKYLFHLSFLCNSQQTHFYEVPLSSSIHNTHSTLRQLITTFLHNTHFFVRISITLKLLISPLNSMTASHIILRFEAITSMKNTHTRMQKLRFEG